MSISQANLFVSLETPLGSDVLVIRDMSLTESLGRLFQIELRLVSEDANIKFDSIVGQNATITMHLDDGKTRCLNGFVSRFVQTALEDRHAHYQATLVPWLWFLTRSADCRIFQGKTVPDIIAEVFDLLGFKEYRNSLSGKYLPWDYCVQYRETAFNFVSRLMEQEGIYYFFEHENGKHTLVLADAHSAHQPFPICDTLPYNPAAGKFPGKEAVLDWTLEQQVQPGTCAVNDFNFEKPKSSLRSKSNVDRSHAHAEYEIYDYPGEYEEHDEGDGYAQLRIEEFQAQYELVRGESNANGISAGFLLTLEDYPRDDQNREYLITEAQYRITNNQPESGGQEVASCSCSFAAIDSSTPFRPARLTPKPIIQGPQTAIVVGPGGEEIHTDKYGRVKVQFHWDRYGKSDENSSFWVRVSQTWAGKNWGVMHVPRMGQEVIVEFLEGDPDQPIITGRVYNADSMPPYDLPGNKTQSGIKSRSSKGGGGGNFNEIRFEDKKGSEQVYIHAEKNQDNVVENDETTDVGHDRTEKVGNDEKITIGNNRTENVGVNEDITIGSNRTEKVGVNEDIAIGSNRTEKVGVDETISIGSNRTETVGANEMVSIALTRTRNVGINDMINVGAAQEITVGAAQAITVGAAQATTVGANQTNTIGKNQNDKVGADRSTSVGKNDTLKVGKVLAIEAGDQVVIKTGEASITMKKDGTIQIKGKDISIVGSGEINVKASKDITMKGNKIKQN